MHVSKSSNKQLNLVTYACDSTSQSNTGPNNNYNNNNNNK